MWKYTNKHYIEYKVQGVEINFNTTTEDASDDSKISSLVSGLVRVLDLITDYYKFVCWENNAYFYWILNSSDVF
jgi:hypothetical protein